MCVGPPSYSFTVANYYTNSNAICDSNCFANVLFFCVCTGITDAVAHRPDAFWLSL